MTFEIEVKALINGDQASSLIDLIYSRHPLAQELAPTSQLNHYFEGGSGEALYAAFGDFTADSKLKSLFKTICLHTRNQSIRTREINRKGSVLIIKASKNNESSSNGSSRIEFESEFDFSIKQLDTILLSCGFKYQAKWSRDRREFLADGFNICLDKNAGYGWLIEVEKVTDDESQLDIVRQQVAKELAAYGLQELSHDRLERMFQFYNANWAKYYGTDKTFEVA